MHYRLLGFSIACIVACAGCVPFDASIVADVAPPPRQHGPISYALNDTLLYVIESQVDRVRVDHGVVEVEVVGELRTSNERCVHTRVFDDVLWSSMLPLLYNGSSTSAQPIKDTLSYVTATVLSINGGYSGRELLRSDARIGFPWPLYAWDPMQDTLSAELLARDTTIVINDVPMQLDRYQLLQRSVDGYHTWLTDVLRDSVIMQVQYAWRPNASFVGRTISERRRAVYQRTIPATLGVTAVRE